MKAQHTILNTESVIGSLNLFIQENQNKPQYSKLEKFDGLAVRPLIDLMFAAKEVSQCFTPHDIVETLLNYAESHLLNALPDPRSPAGSPSITVDKTECRDLMFDVRQLLIYFTKTFEALRNFEMATGMV